MWSAGFLLFEPAPNFFLFEEPGGSGGGRVVGLMAGILAVLGVSETFVFLPFVPLVHNRFQDKLGWSEGETEDVVSSLWYVAFPPSLFPSFCPCRSSPLPPSLFSSLPPSVTISCSPLPPSLPTYLPTSLPPSLSSGPLAGVQDRR